MASVTVALTGYADNGQFIFWQDDVSIGSTFARDGGVQILDTIGFGYGPFVGGDATVNLTTANDRFTAAFEATGRIIVTASDGETLEVTIADADMSEPYSWTPTNSAEVLTFANHVRGLTDRNATLTLTDDPPATDHAVDAGDASWAIDLPAANGNAYKRSAH